KGIIFITILLSLIVYIYPGAVISMVAPGFRNGKRQLAARLIQIAFPACIFLSLSALTNITLNGLKKFVLPASADLAFKGLILLSLVILYKYAGVYAAAVGILLGAISKLLIQFSLLYRKWSFRASFVDPAYGKNVWKLSWPLLLGVSFSQVNTLAEN